MITENLFRVACHGPEGGCPKKAEVTRTSKYVALADAAYRGWSERIVILQVGSSKKRLRLNLCPACTTKHKKKTCGTCGKKLLA